MIKLIIFDLGGVLFTNGTKRFIEVISERYNLEKEKVKDVMDGEIGTEYREGKIGRDEFWKRVVEKLNINEDIDKLESEWIDGYELIEGTRDIILQLREKYKVFYLSDNVRERVERINAKYGFMDWFSSGVFSHEAGVRKPDPEIYKLTLAKAGEVAGSAVFIDDKPQFLVPAAELGMTTFLFESPEKLREELKEKGILS